jgi:hypothetical protein
MSNGPAEANMVMPVTLAESGGCGCPFCLIGFQQYCLSLPSDELVNLAAVRISVSLTPERLQRLGVLFATGVLRACAEQRVEDAREEMSRRVREGVDGFDEVFDDGADKPVEGVM